MTSRRTKISPKSGCGLGHVTPTIFGSTIGYPSDSLASCPKKFWECRQTPVLTRLDRSISCSLKRHKTATTGVFYRQQVEYSQRRSWRCLVPRLQVSVSAASSSLFPTPALHNMTNMHCCPVVTITLLVTIWRNKTVSKHWRRVVGHPDRPQSNKAPLTMLQ